MAESSGYSAPIHMNQGGKVMQVGTSGDLEVYGDIDVKSAGQINLESGGAIDIASGGQVDVASGGHIDLETGGYIAAASGGYVTLADGSYLTLPFVAATTGTPITNFGVTTINSTGAAKAFTLAVPGPGRLKAIICTGVAGTSAPLTVSTTGTIDGGTVATFNADKDALWLMGVSATAYYVLSNNGTVATS